MLQPNRILRNIGFVKKFIKIIIPILIITLCVAVAIHFDVFNKDEEPTATQTTASTEKKSKYQSYMDKNSDFVGYIKIDGTAVDYPVVQCNDDVFYLNHNFEKKPEEYGYKSFYKGFVFH